MSIIKRKAGSEDIVKSVLEFDEVPTEGSHNMVESGAVAYLTNMLPQPSTIVLPLEFGFYSTNGTKVAAKSESSSYKCCKYLGEVGDSFFIVGTGASWGRLWATFDKDENIIRRADASISRKWDDQLIITLEEGEVGIVYNTEFSSLTTELDAFIRLINLCVGHEAQTKRLNAVNKDLVGASVNKIIEYAKASGSTLSFYYYPTAPTKFYVKNNSSSYTSYRIFWTDSTGTNPNTEWGSGFNFDKTVSLDAYREGYDGLIIYNGNTSSEAISIDLYEYNLDSVNYRLEKTVQAIEVPAENLAYNFTAPLGNRLSFYYIPKKFPFEFRLEKNIFEYDNYDIYFSDSSGTNQNIVFRTGVPFDEDLKINSLPEGYDRLLFFRNGYTEIYSIDVDLIVYATGSLNYKILMLERQIEMPYRNQKIVCFGDSITQFEYNGKGYPDYLQELSQANVVKGGIGGTRYSLRGTPTGTPSSVAEAWRALDIASLVHAWCTNDWTVVDACVDYLHDHDNRNYAPIITRLKNNPVATADVVTIMAGTNDFSSEASLGTSGSFDALTVFGAINSIVRDILTTNPKIKLFMFTPTVRWYDYSGIATSDPDNFSDVIVRGGVTLREFSAAVAGEITKNHIPVCDMYNTLGWNMYNFSNYFLDTDGTHPYKGFENIAERFYAFLVAQKN